MKLLSKIKTLVASFLEDGETKGIRAPTREQRQFMDEVGSTSFLYLAQGFLCVHHANEVSHISSFVSASGVVVEETRWPLNEKDIELFQKRSTKVISDDDKINLAVVESIWNATP